MPLPGTASVAPSLFVIDRSALGVRVSVSVALLLPGVGSVVPDGTATVAVLLSEPVADALTVALTVYVAVPLANRFTVSLMLPLPDALQLEPEDAVHVQVTLVRLAGIVSLTVAPVTSLGPLFVATIVSVMPLPGTASVAPSLFVIAKIGPRR